MGYRARVFRVAAVALALGCATSARAWDDHANAFDEFLSWETSSLEGFGHHHKTPAGFGTISAAAVATCDRHCGLRVGLLQGFDFDIEGGPGEWLSSASVEGSHGSASASGSIPSTGTLSSTFVYTLDTLGADALPSGRGSLAAAGSLAWDDLTFSGVTPGETATLSLTLTLTTPDSLSSGLGGGCLAIDALCDPLRKSPLTGSSPTETLTKTFALSSTKPLLIFDALYALAGPGNGSAGADVSGILTLTLPSNVSFTAASGDSGGPSAVPLPDSAGLLLCGCAALAMMGLLRRRASSAPLARMA